RRALQKVHVLLREAHRVPRRDGHEALVVHASDRCRLPVSEARPESNPPRPPGPGRSAREPNGGVPGALARPRGHIRLRWATPGGATGASNLRPECPRAHPPPTRGEGRRNPPGWALLASAPRLS